MGSLKDAPDPDLFEPLTDACQPKVVRGHYIKVAVQGSLRDHAGRFLSYNYTPTTEVYRAHDELAADVYCYPRSDGWILGGSRQLRATDTAGVRWVGDHDGQKTESFERADGQLIAVPRPIFSLNAELIDNISAGEVSLERLRRGMPDAFSACVGYRFERADPKESVRLACSRVRLGGREVVIIHNYGHGGAGFTLSWGCALDVLRTVERLAAAGWPNLATSSSVLAEGFRIPGRMLVAIAEENWPSGEAADRSENRVT